MVPRLQLNTHMFHIVQSLTNTLMWHISIQNNLYNALAVLNSFVANSEQSAIKDPTYILNSGA